MTTGQILCVGMMAAAGVIWYLGWSMRSEET
jgi:hypothetical protein